MSEQRERDAEAGAKAYAEAEQQLTDRPLFERVKAAHPLAASSAEAVKIMVDDYNRLKAEQDRQRRESNLPTQQMPS